MHITWQFAFVFAVVTGLGLSAIQMTTASKRTESTAFVAVMISLVIATYTGLAALTS